jgi:hypothetical protein
LGVAGCGTGVWTQVFYRLSHSSSPFYMAILEMGEEGLLSYLPWLASNCDPPNLSLPSS